MKSDKLHFRVDTPALLKEISDCGLSRTMGVYKVPLNVFRTMLGLVAQRAIELDDPQLNILMLELSLYEIDPHKVVGVIQEQKNRIKP